MPTQEELDQAAVIGPDLARHCAMCRGEYCGACDVPLVAHAGRQRGMRLCLECWPNPAVSWHALHISILWSAHEWTVCFSNRTPEYNGPPVGYWMLLHDRAECSAILDRYLCRRKDRTEFGETSDAAGHATIGVFVSSRRLAALAAATRKDSRTGYDKRQLHMGRANW